MSSTFKDILLWAHGRGSWQYDLLCVLIVLVLLLWPEHSLK